jgi:histidinol-phosphate aminotransferase
VLRLPPAVHGTPDRAELRRLGIDPNGVLDFSACTNPYGPPPGVGAALVRVRPDEYPDRAAETLRTALADRLGFTPAQLLPGNGACELIWLASLAFVRPGDRVLVLGPTFCEYARAAALLGGRVVNHCARAEEGFVPAPAAVERQLKRLRPRLVFVCNPNNPTGHALPPEVIGAWARARPRTLFVVDEAYLPFAPGLGSALDEGAANVLVLRSLTKDLGLAGLRLGLAAGPAELIDALARVQPPWSVNAFAQAAGVAALADPGHWQRCLHLLGRAKAELLGGLAALGLAPCPSAVHFFLLPVADGAAFRLALLAHGVLVRDGASFGLPGHVRIATRRPEDNARLLAAVAEECHAR